MFTRYVALFVRCFAISQLRNSATPQLHSLRRSVCSLLRNLATPQLRNFTRYVAPLLVASQSRNSATSLVRTSPVDSYGGAKPPFGISNVVPVVGGRTPPYNRLGGGTPQGETANKNNINKPQTVIIINKQPEKLTSALEPSNSRRRRATVESQ
jgi:hypothetical protein